MRARKKKFMLAGSIGSFVEAGIAILVITILACFLHLITKTNISKLLDATGLFSHTLVNGEIVYLYSKTNGTSIAIASSDIGDFANWLKLSLMSSIITTLVLSIATIIINIFVVEHAKRGEQKKWAIISSLVLDVFMFNMVSMAFMITSLALIKKNENNS